MRWTICLLPPLLWMGCFCKQGNGELEEMVLTTEAFRTLSIDGSYDVDIAQGDTDDLRLTIDSNLVDNVIHRLRDDTLKLDNRRCAIPSATPRVRGTVTSLREIIIDGTSDIRCEDIDQPSFRTDFDGDADITLRGETDDLEVDIDGSGILRAFDLQAEDCLVEIDGEADVEVACSQTLRVSIDGQADVTYEGTPTLSQDIDGQGSISPR